MCDWIGRLAQVSSAARGGDIKVRATMPPVEQMHYMRLDKLL